MEEHSENPQPSQGGPSLDRGAVIGALIAAGAAVMAVLVDWFLGRSLREVEALSALTLLFCGVFFVIRWVIHLKLGYLWFSESMGEGWDKAKRWRLCLLTLADGALAIAITVSGLAYLQHPNRFLQGAVTLILMLSMAGVIETTRRLIGSGGPDCGADVIETCRPVSAFLDPDRGWNGPWGIDAGVKVVSSRIPVGKRNKAAFLLILGLLLSLLTQSGVVVGRMIKGQDPSLPGSHAARKHNSRESGMGRFSDPGGEATSTGGTLTEGGPCGTEVIPGDGVPEPLKAQIKQSWEEKAPASGCARRARLNESRTAYLVPGECQGMPWSLGIVSWDYGAGVLLEHASVAARRIGRRHELIGASIRTDLAGGDFHLVYTSVGPYLLVRAHKTDGEGGLVKAPESCADIELGNEQYVVLPPGMAELWIRLNREVTETWPVPSEETEADFAFETRNREPFAWGSCETATSCEIHGPGIAMESTLAGIREVTVGTVLEAGPALSP